MNQDAVFHTAEYVRTQCAAQASWRPVPSYVKETQCGTHASLGNLCFAHNLIDPFKERSFVSLHDPSSSFKGLGKGVLQGFSKLE